MAAPTYHLWLKPPGRVHELLAETIRKLATELGAPVFEPHVTLLSNLAGTEPEHLRRTEEIGRRLPPVPITLTAPSHGDEYFQCVFMRVEPTSQVIGANTLANEIFESVPSSYFPHLSLVYGLFSETRKLEVIANLPATLCSVFEAKAVHLIKAHSSQPRDWQEIAAVPTTGLAN